MRARGVVVREVTAQQAAEMPFVQHDDVIEAFPSNRPDDSLGERILPGRSRCDEDLANPQAFCPPYEHIAVVGVPIAEQVLGRCLFRKALDQLVGGPGGGGVVGREPAGSRRRESTRPVYQTARSRVNRDLRFGPIFFLVSHWRVGDVAPSPPCCPLATGETTRCRSASAADLASSESWPPAVATLPPASARFSAWAVRAITWDATRVAECGRESAERGSRSSDFRRAGGRGT